MVSISQNIMFRIYLFLLIIHLFHTRFALLMTLSFQMQLNLFIIYFILNTLQIFKDFISLKIDTNFHHFSNQVFKDIYVKSFTTFFLSFLDDFM